VPFGKNAAVYTSTQGDQVQADRSDQGSVAAEGAVGGATSGLDNLSGRLCPPAAPRLTAAHQAVRNRLSTSSMLPSPLSVPPNSLPSNYLDGLNVTAPKGNRKSRGYLIKKLATQITSQASPPVETTTFQFLTWALGTILFELQVLYSRDTPILKSTSATWASLFVPCVS